MKLLILTILLLPFIANAKLEPVENDYLVKAIKENDLEKFKAILKKANNPFKDNSLFGDVDELAIKYSTQELQYRIANSNGCKDDFIQEMLKYGFKPMFSTDTSSGGKDLSIWQTLCPKTIELLIPFFESRGQIEIGKIVAAEVHLLFKKTIGGSAIPTTEAELNNAADSVAIFKNKAKQECKDYDLKNNWCQFKDLIEDYQKSMRADMSKIEKEEKAQEYANSPEGIKERICELQNEIKEAQEAISRQKEIAKTSGVVDKSVLHSKGASIVDLKKEISNLKAGLKSKQIKCN
jgi:hypothetical protein